MRRAEDAQPLGIATVEQFASNQRGFYRLADTDIVSYQHPHRVELSAIMRGTNW
jgi:hypothetical protein